MLKLEDVEKAINDKTQFKVEILDVVTNVSDLGHYLDCHMRFLDGLFKGEKIFVKAEWD